MKKIFESIGMLVLILGLFLSTPEIVRGADKLSGMDIMEKARNLYGGEDQISTVTLRLINKDGDERKIVTRRYWKHYGGKDGFDSKTLFITEFPPDAKGVGFLIWDYSKKGKPDGLWLYLPSLRTVRKLSARDQNDAFMGSDLTFGDMGQRRLDEDEHRLVKEARLNGEPCYVIESLPKEEGGIYGKKLVWISKKDFRTLKIDYYDIKMDKLKTQILEWKKFGKALVYQKMEVTNVQKNHKTLYEISDLQLDNGLKDGDFKDRVLKRGLRR